MEKVKLLSKNNLRGFIQGKVYSARKKIVGDMLFGSEVQYEVQGEDGIYKFVEDSDNTALNVWVNFELVSDVTSPKTVNDDTGNVHVLTKEADDKGLSYKTWFVKEGNEN